MSSDSFDLSSSSLGHPGSGFVSLKMDAERARRARIEAWAAQQLLDPGKTFLLDTETTGLMTSGYDEVVEVGVIDGTGNVLFESLCRPQTINRPSLGDEIHGITRDMLINAPSFSVVFDGLVRVLRQAGTILVYNLGYDRLMLTSTARRYGLSLPKLPWCECAMEQYASWYGERNTRRSGFKWQRLNDACQYLQTPAIAGYASHRAIGDALSTLEVLRALAARHQASTVPTLENTKDAHGPDRAPLGS